MFRALPFIFTLTAFAQTPSLTEEKVYGRDAWVLSNGIMRVAALRGGGHLAEIRLLSSDPKKNLNPMRVPHYPTIDPHTFDPARHSAIYGTDTHRFLSAGYMGHLICFPFYGPPSSDDEAKAGLGNHGEASIVAWQQTGIERNDNTITLRYAADLVKTQYRIERTITLRKGANSVRVEEWVENLTNYDRPFQWMQHATFGPPFVEPGKIFLDSSAVRAATAQQTDAPILRPMQTKEHITSYTALLLDPKRQTQFFTLYHTAYRLLIGYVFPSKQNPWLADWQENKSAQFLPWNGQVIARGLEFGNSAFAEGLRKAIARGSLFDVPSYGWIGAHQKLKNEFTIFLLEVPENYKGVKDIQTTDEGGSLRITKLDR